LLDVLLFIVTCIIIYKLVRFHDLLNLIM